MSMPTRWSGHPIVGLELVERLGGVEQSHAAAGDDAFFDRGAGRVHGVLDTVLALLHLDLGGTADTDHRHAAGQLGQALLQLLLVIVRGGLLDLRADLGAAALDVRFFLPPPSTTVVSSLVMITFLAVPSMSRVTFSSLMPRSSEIT